MSADRKYVKIEDDNQEDEWCELKTNDDRQKYSRLRNPPVVNEEEMIRILGRFSRKCVLKICGMEDNNENYNTDSTDLNQEQGNNINNQFPNEIIEAIQNGGS